MKRALERELQDVPAVFLDNAPAMIGWVEAHLREVALLSLDHDLGPTREKDGARFHPGDGRDVTDWLCDQAPVCPVVLHTSNPVGRDAMRTALELKGWTVETVPPFDDLDWIDRAWIKDVSRMLSRGA